MKVNQYVPLSLTTGPVPASYPPGTASKRTGCLLFISVGVSGHVMMYPRPPTARFDRRWATGYMKRPHERKGPCQPRSLIGYENALLPASRYLSIRPFSVHATGPTSDPIPGIPCSAMIIFSGYVSNFKDSPFHLIDSLE